MAGIGDSTLFPNSYMAAAAQLGQSRFRSGEITSVQPSGGAPLFAAFNPATAINVTLSNNNLTALHPGGASAGAVATPYLNNGKYYFEFLYQSLGSNGSSVCVGILSSVGAINEDASLATNSIAVFLGTNTFLYSNGVNTNKNFGGRAAGDVWGIAVDLTSRLAWFRKNGGLWNADAAASPTTGVNGVAFAAGSYAPWVRFPGGTTGETMIGNFGAAAYANAAPSGFVNWPSS